MPTFADSVMVNAAVLNTVSTGINALASLRTGAVQPRAYVPICVASLTSTRSIPNNSDTLVTLQTAGINNDGMWSSGVAQLTIKTAGTYLAWAQTTFDANTSGVRASHILLNGTSVSANAVAGASDNALTVAASINQIMCRTPPLALAVNATLYLSVYQNSGGSLNVDSVVSGTFLSVLRIGN